MSSRRMISIRLPESLLVQLDAWRGVQPAGGPSVTAIVEEAVTEWLARHPVTARLTTLEDLTLEMRGYNRRVAPGSECETCTVRYTVDSVEAGRRGDRGERRLSVDVRLAEKPASRW